MNGVRYAVTQRKGYTYVNLPSAQQFVLANSVVIVYPGVDLGLTGVDHEGALFIPKSRSVFRKKERTKMSKTRYQLHSELVDLGR